MVMMTCGGGRVRIRCCFAMLAALVCVACMPCVMAVSALTVCFCAIPLVHNALWHCFEGGGAADFCVFMTFCHKFCE